MKWLKWALWAVLVVILVVVIAVGIFAATFDANAYKERITAEVHQATGRDLAMDGDISLTFFPLGFSLGETRLSNAPGFGDQPFASVDEVAVRIAILPLLQNEVRVDRVILRGLSLDLQRDARGVTNWDDLVPESETTAESSAAEPESGLGPAEQRALPTVYIGGVDIDRARVSWRDAQAGTDLRLDPFNLSAGAFAFGEPMPLHLDFRLEQGSPVTALIVALDAQVTADPNSGKYRVADMVVDTEIKGQDIPSGSIESRLTADLVADLEAQTAQIEGFELRTLGVKLAGALNVTDLLGDLKAAGSLRTDRFSPREVMRELAIAVPETSDADVLTKAELRAELSATTSRADLKSLTFVLDDTTVKGNASVSEFARPAIDFGVTVDAINVDRYLPPPAPQPVAAPAADPGATAVDDSIPLPVEALRTLDADGTADVGQVIIAGLTVSDAHVTLAAHDGLVRLEPMSLKLYDGALDGRASLDVRGDTPLYRTHQELKGVDMEALQADLLEKVWLSGATELVATLSTAGDSISGLKRNLNGDMRFAFSDGAFKDEKLASTVNTIRKIVYDQQAEAGGNSKEVPFTSMKGTATVRDGVATNKDLYVLTPILQARGEGTVDLVKGRINYDFGIAKLGGDRTYLYTRVKGPFADLSYKPDLERWAKDSVKRRTEEQVEQKEEEIKEEIEEKVRDRLKGLFGN